MEHLALLARAKEAVSAVFSDQSVTQAEMQDSLDELLEYIEEMRDTLN